MRSPAEILREASTIALVGASPRPGRASHDVMRYLLEARWLQLGLRSPEARRVALESGLDYVEDLCTAVVRRREL